jgi:hypothetical protein
MRRCALLLVVCAAAHAGDYPVYPAVGSTYVPLDSWVYPAFDRLAALGFAPTAFMGLRPWTRMECARLLEEAEDQVNDGAQPEVASLYESLAREFAAELARQSGAKDLGAEVESVYARVTGISGTPLRDGYHFGQTIINDFGRPYAEGLNVVTGMSARATAGPFAFYVRGEYQHAPGIADPIERPRETVFADEFNTSTLPPHRPIPEVNRTRLLDAYVAFNLKNWQISFGKQSLWWGPSSSGPLMWSSNADPVWMLRLSQSNPIKLPSILGWLGPVRSEMLFGRFAGHHFVRTQRGSQGNFDTPLANQPFVYAQKLSFKPTPNLEFGVSRSGIFGGPDFPLTFGNVGRAVFSMGNIFGGGDPGDRRAGFDFRYRIPGLRKWLVLYNDSLAEDEMSPIGYPRRSAMNPGLYMPAVPKIPKLDLRVEAVYTDLPGLRHNGFYYWNLRYLDGYSNRGDILGSWVGRQGRGFQLWSTYWLSAASTIQFRYRTQKVSPAFLKGGSLQDFAVHANLRVREDVYLDTRVQYERWNFPLLTSGDRSNLSTSIQLTYTPKWSLRKNSP